jgi:hypothetical protein
LNAYIHGYIVPTTAGVDISDELPENVNVPREELVALFEGAYGTPAGFEYLELPKIKVR